MIKTLNYQRLEKIINSHDQLHDGVYGKYHDGQVDGAELKPVLFEHRTVC